MQQILKKYQEKIEKLNVFEKQTLKNLMNYSSQNGMSRFYLVFDSNKQAIRVDSQGHLAPFSKR